MASIRCKGQSVARDDENRVETNRVESCREWTYADLPAKLHYQGRTEGLENERRVCRGGLWVGGREQAVRQLAGVLKLCRHLIVTFLFYNERSSAPDPDHRLFLSPPLPN